MHSTFRLHSAFPDTHAPYMQRKAYRGQVVPIQFSVVSSLPSLFDENQIKWEIKSNFLNSPKFWKRLQFQMNEMYSVSIILI